MAYSKLSPTIGFVELHSGILLHLKNSQVGLKLEITTYPNVSNSLLFPA